MGSLNDYSQPSQPRVSQSGDLSQLSSTLPTNSEPVKRKRGRPPKKLTQHFPTMTLQFTTSTDATSPTAELNSNLMVKLGEPDSFTPLMKVSPTIHHKRRRRKSSVSTVETDDLPGKRRGKESEMLTPMSTSSVTSSYSRSGYVVNATAMENMSMITGSGNAPLPPYNTPPHLLIRSTFSNVGGLLGGFDDAGSGGGASGSPNINIESTADLIPQKLINRANIVGMARKYPSLDSRANLTSKLVASASNLGVNANLANLGNLGNSGKTSSSTTRGLDDLHALNVKNFDQLPNTEKSDSSETQTRNLPRQVQELNDTTEPNLVSFIDDGKFLFQLVVDDLGRASLADRKDTAVSWPNNVHLAEIDPLGHHSLELQPPPKLPHAHTALGIETMRPQEKSSSSTSSSSKNESRSHMDSKWDRQNSATAADDGPEKYIVPQTPKGRDDFYVGYTPKYDSADALAYNLTPQFNSMMYSMMSINSPQQKGYHQQPFFNAEALNVQYGRTNGAIASSIDTELLGHRSNINDLAQNELLSPDEGDARAALKNIFRMKRDT